MSKYNYGSEPLNNGDRVKIIGLTDIDEPGQQYPDDFGWIGQYGIVVQAVMNDYYDCLVKLERGIADEAVIRAYGNPPTLAMMYDDLENVGGCKCCIAPDALSHSTEEHTEDWVNLADARYTGEVILIGAPVWTHMLDLIWPRDTRGAIHVDRRIIQAIVDSLEDEGDFWDEDRGAVYRDLKQLLQDNLERPGL